jgi:hypothetical protein
MQILRFKQCFILWFYGWTISGSYESQRIKAKKSGYKKGFPDLFIYEPRGEFNGLAIELKVGKNRATKEQLWWRNELNKRGYLQKYAQA